MMEFEYPEKERISRNGKGRKVRQRGENGTINKEYKVWVRLCNKEVSSEGLLPGGEHKMYLRDV